MLPNYINSRVANALVEARAALHLAETQHRRTDCLRVAVEALNGALRNLIMEDDEAKKARNKESAER